jgi:hypothetical protein
MDLLDGNVVATAVYEAVLSRLHDLGTFDVRTSKSQIAFWRRHGFAYLWLPGRYLRHPGAEVVLSIVLDHHDRSDRFKEVAHPSPRHWIHHLEVHAATEIDDEVTTWLREAFAHAD